jgi:hypothetical protein
MPYLFSTLDQGDISASRPGCFIPREKDPYNYCAGDWVNPRAGLDAAEK